MLDFIECSSLSFDDVLLVPQSGLPDSLPLWSRDDISTSIQLFGKQFSVPILNAPMDTICGEQLYKELSDVGALPVECRFATADSALEFVRESKGEKPVVISVSTNLEQISSKINVYQQFYENLSDMIILIDTANGYSPLTTRAIRCVKELTDGKAHVIAGNVCTAEGMVALFKVGADAVRVGIGNGSACSTRLMTGVGMGQVTALMECVEERDLYYPGKVIIADGGIRTPADFCKAIAIGADMVMLGRAFAGCKSIPEWAKDLNNNRALYRGMASKQVMEANDIITIDRQHSIGKLPEGEATYVLLKNKTATQIVKEYEKGLRSSMSYGNMHNIDQFVSLSVLRRTSNAVFVESQVRRET